MKKIRFCCMVTVVVFLAVTMAYAQKDIVIKPVGENTAPQIDKMPQKPVKQRPGAALGTSVNADIANIGIMLTKLTVDPGLDTYGHRYAHLEMRNAGSQPVEYGQYFLKYWWRAGASDDWQYQHAATFQTPLAPHQTKTMNIPVGPLSDAKEFRITLHKDRQGPVILEIATPVNSD